MTYDYLVVGAGLFGAVVAQELTRAGRSVLVLEKRSHIGGNCYTELQKGILLHRYGAHIFHTDSEPLWQYMQSFGRFVPYCHCLKASFKGRLYSLPFSLYTFREMWGVTDAAEALRHIEQDRAGASLSPKNLEEQAVSMIGRELFETLVKGYTEKQWGRSCTELPAEIIRRIPLRFTYDDNYFTDRFQGIPAEGYTAVIARMLTGSELRLNTDYLRDRGSFDRMAGRVIYTGPIDAYFDYCLGALAYRSLRFEDEWLPVADYQGRAVINYTDRETPYTRIIEHKHFSAESAVKSAPYTVITREYSAGWVPGAEPYYPINDDANNALYRAYLAKAKAQNRVCFGGRLGEYRYYDMDDTVASALALSRSLLSGDEHEKES